MDCEGWRVRIRQPANLANDGLKPVRTGRGNTNPEKNMDSLENYTRHTTTLEMEVRDRDGDWMSVEVDGHEIIITCGDEVRIFSIGFPAFVALKEFFTSV